MAKECANCKYRKISLSGVPCNFCKMYKGEEDNWEPEDKLQEMENKDNVNHPSHYEDKCSLECIEAMELIFGEGVYNFCLLNAWKYVWRYKNKNGTEDLEKARWYINRCKKYIGNPDMYTDFEDIVENIDQWLLSHNIV